MAFQELQQLNSSRSASAIKIPRNRSLLWFHSVPRQRSAGLIMESRWVPGHFSDLRLGQAKKLTRWRDGDDDGELTV